MQHATTSARTQSLTRSVASLRLDGRAKDAEMRAKDAEMRAKDAEIEALKTSLARADAAVEALGTSLARAHSRAGPR